MALKARLGIYLALCALVLLGVAVIGSRLSERVAERIRLGVETRSIRKLHRLALEESRIADEILLLPSHADFQLYHKLLEAIEEELEELEALPATPETNAMLPRWHEANGEFKQLLEKVAFQKPVRSLVQAREVLKRLRARGAEQLGILKAAGDRLRAELQSEDVRIQTQIHRHWQRVLALMALPVLVIVLLTASFGRNLGRQLTQLETAFLALGQGKLETRLDQASASLPGTRSVFRSFDELAERLQQLDCLKSEFYSMAAHDLRSPLGTILFGIENLRAQGNLGAAGASAVDTIERKARTMLDLTNSLLDRFFIERGRVEARFQQVDVNQVLRHCLEDLGARAAARNQKLEMEPMEGDAALWCDPTMLTQILDNLVGNAIKYSRDGDAIRFGAKLAQDAFVHFHVTDNGPGIPARELANLFAPFHRVRSDADGAAGWGLGLAICRQFVAAHDGKIWCESQEGVGCSFRFTVPHVKDPVVGSVFLPERANSSPRPES